MHFRYLTDPLFLLCLALYSLNRWVLKPYFPNEFSQNYFNDLICLPFWIPIMLFIMKKIGLRADDAPPGGAEILIPLLLWSWLFEAYLPNIQAFKGVAIADHVDILCYAVGGLIAAIAWRLYYPARGSRTAS